MITNAHLSGYDNEFTKQALRVPSIGEILTGLGSSEAWRDFKRLALIGVSVPVGLLGLNYLRLYGNKDLLAGITTQDIPPTAITMEDYYKVLEEEKKNLKSKKRVKKSSANTKLAANTFQRVMNVFAHYPLLSIAALMGIPMVTDVARKGLFQPLEKQMITKEIQDTKMEYLRTLRRTSLLSRKILSGTITDEELKSLPEEVRRRAAEKVRARTGVDVSGELGLKSEKEASVKQAIWWLPGQLWSIVRIVPVLPTALFGMGVFEGYRQRPFGQSTQELKEQIKEWQSRVYPYMVEARSVLPPEEFFEEIEEEEPAPAKRLKPKSESAEEALNRYVKQRLRELEEAEAEVRKVRGTKILSKAS